MNHSTQLAERPPAYDEPRYANRLAFMALQAMYWMQTPCTLQLAPTAQSTQSTGAQS